MGYHHYAKNAGKKRSAGPKGLLVCGEIKQSKKRLPEIKIALGVVCSCEPPEEKAPAGMVSRAPHNVFHPETSVTETQNTVGARTGVVFFPLLLEPPAAATAAAAAATLMPHGLTFVSVFLGRLCMLYSSTAPPNRKTELLSSSFKATSTTTVGPAC